MDHSTKHLQARALNCIGLRHNRLPALREANFRLTETLFAHASGLQEMKGMNSTGSERAALELQWNLWRENEALRRTECFLWVRSTAILAG
jgi:hypothetical protein